MNGKIVTLGGLLLAGASVAGALVASREPAGWGSRARVGAARIALIGDSHTQVLWPKLRPRLQQAGHEVVLEIATPGYSTWSYMTRRRGVDVEPGLLAARPDVVIYSLGGNNMKVSSAQESAYRAELSWAVDLARRAGASKVLWIGPATSNPAAGDVAARTSARHEATAEIQRRLLPPMGVHWFDARPWTQRGHRDDGVHFTRGAYARWSDRIAAAALPVI